jgi:hypothetical protein
MFSIKTLKVVAAIAAFMVSAITIGSLLNQSALAQANQEGLRPPFNLQPATQPHAADDVGLPFPGSTVIFTETFGPAFAPTTNLASTSTEWRVMTNTGAADYYWGGVSGGGFEPSAWPAAAQIVPGIFVTYPANLDTWLIYGPLDLKEFASASMSFDYYVDTTPGSCQPAYSGDCLTWAYSYDGQTFYGSQISGHLSPASGWLSGSLILDNKQFQTSPVYIAFAFKGGSNPSGNGAFIRNLAVTGNPIKYAYLPLVFNNYTPPPPPPTPPLFGYDFDDDGTDLAHWGGAYYNSGTKKYGQCIPGQCTVPIALPSPHGNLTNSLRLYTNALYHFVATSPNDSAPTSYDLFVDISPIVFYDRDAGCALYGCPDNDLGDWYGVIFNASSDTFGSDLSGFAYNKKYYRLYFYPIDATKPIAVQLDRCDGSANAGNNSCTRLDHSSLPANFIGNPGGWDQIHIMRDGSNGDIKVYLNDQLLLTASDNNYTGASFGKYGMFIFSWTKNDTGPLAGTQMQVDFDNIQIYSR